MIEEIDTQFNARSNQSSWRAVTHRERPHHRRSNLILRHRLITYWGVSFLTSWKLPSCPSSHCFDMSCLDFFTRSILSFILTMYSFPCQLMQHFCRVAVAPCSVHFCIMLIDSLKGTGSRFGSAIK